MPGLRPIANQRDFSSGMWKSQAPHQIPQNGCYELLNFLIDNEGLPYERGGVEELSHAFSSSDLVFVYDGQFSTGRRTFFATETEFGVLDVDGVTPIMISPSDLTGPVRGTFVGQSLYLDGGRIYSGADVYAFSSGGAPTAGTASLAVGSDTVIGSGTAFLTAAAPGMNFGFGLRNYVVKSVTDDTHLVLTQKAKETTSGAIYALQSVGHSTKIADIYGTAGKRLLALIDDKMYFSRNIDNEDEILTLAGTGGGGGAAFAGIEIKPDQDPENFHDGDYQQIPGGPTGLGLSSWGDTAVVFTTDGVWLVSNMDLDPVDTAGNVQQTLTHSAPNIVLWHRNGIASFEDALIVPARDGIYIMGATSLERLDAPITPLYRSYVRAGYTLGLATVVEGHYILPVLSGIDYVDTLVCRLDRPYWQGRHLPLIYPWTHFNGLPLRALARQETDSSPNLLIASSGNKLLRARYFEPDVVPSEDAVTGVFTSDLITRDFPTGNGNQNVVREIDVDYDLIDTAANDNPTLTVGYGTGHPVETATFTTLADPGPEGADTFKRWLLPEAERSRYIRIRLRSSGRLQRLIIRAITVLARQSAKND